MEQEMAPAAPARYRAFISYSHADASFAGWLHRKLEAWRLPDKSRLAPMFIDRAELAAGEDLSAKVRDALAESAALIVVASPNARASRWVGQEIELFRAMHPDRPVLAGLIAGEPADAFPDPLVQLGDRTVEPLAADFRDGHDGKRLGLIKIVAGLTAQPLDRLVQRDAQSRQRRVMAVTAGALLLSLVLSTSLIFALRARAEAERQRNEAEGLVEYMLTDLRDKLKGVGRLDVMDDVNERALAYYAMQPDLSLLEPESLDRRGRLIEAMGQDNELLGEADKAYAKYQEVFRITRDLLSRDPGNPQRIFAHARSENRLALIEATRGNSRVALPHFKSALGLLNRLPKDQARPDWSALRSLVLGNLCAITLSASNDAKGAVAFCREAIRLAQQASALKPTDRTIQYDLVFHYLWLGDALSASGLTKEAQKARDDGLAETNLLVASEPNNWLWLEQHCEVNLHLSTIARKAGQAKAADTYRDQARADAQLLARHDPTNAHWAGLLRQANR